MCAGGRWLELAVAPRFAAGFYLKTVLDTETNTAREGGRTMRSKSGFTLIELLIVVVIIGLLAAIAIPKFATTKEKAYVSTMKGDLRNLATAQETYWNDNGVYYGGSVPSGQLVYNPSVNTTITINVASGAGWAASATHNVTAVVCALFSGPVAPPSPATVEGQIACQ
jgi:prepilin-type N-terminal cleavage/methylation domain-containing protein